MKNKKRFISILLIGLIALSSGISVSAAETEIADSSEAKTATADEAVHPSDHLKESIPSVSEYSSKKENTKETTANEEETEADEQESSIESINSELYADITPYIKHGDVNGDGEINADDVTVILKYISGNTDSINEDMISRSDINGDKTIDITDATMIQQYISGKISYFDLISRMDEMPLYLQYNEPWCNYPFGDGTIGNSGCGPTSIAMVASYLTGLEITPDNVAEFLSEDENGGRFGHYIPGAGMTHDVWELCAKHYGFIYKEKASGIDEAYQALQSGKVVICSQREGIFTSSGHFIVLSGLWDDGSIKINDPNDNNTNKNFKNIHFTKDAVAQSGVCYYVFDSYETLNAPKSEEEFVMLFNRYFSQRGYNKAAICGMLGNIYAECSMNSGSYFAEYIQDAGGAPGNSNGICQWYGANCDRFRRDCPDWNKSVMAQFKYLAETLDNNGNGSGNTKFYYGCAGCKDTLVGKVTEQNKKWIENNGKVTNTREGAKVAARAFMDLYERPNAMFDQSIRWIKAEQYWDMID